MSDKAEKKSRLLAYLKKDITAPVSEFLPKLESGIFSKGTKDAAKGVASILTKDLTSGTRKNKIKTATRQTLLSVVRDLTQKGELLSHEELDVLLQLAADSKTEKQTLTLIQNTNKPENYPNKSLVVARVQPDDIPPVLKLLKTLDHPSQALLIARKANPGDLKGTLPFLIPLLDKNIRVTLINKCPVRDLPGLFESFKAIPMTADEVNFLRKSKLRPDVVMLIFNAMDATNYSPELIHWAANHTSGADIFSIYRKTKDYLDGMLHDSEDPEDHEVVVRLYKLMFMKISLNPDGLTKYVQASVPSPADLVSLNNIFALVEKEGMLICTRSNADDIYAKFLRLSYDICCLIGAQELFDREKESAFIAQDLTVAISTPPNVVAESAVRLLDGYIKAYGAVMATRYKRDEFPQFYNLARLLNQIVLAFRRAETFA